MFYIYIEILHIYIFIYGIYNVIYTLKLLQQKFKSTEDVIHKFYKEPLVPLKPVISSSFTSFGSG
jgi:hypothetical protein